MTNLLKLLKKKIIEFLESGALFKSYYSNPYLDTGPFKQYFYDLIKLFYDLQINCKYVKEGFIIRLLIEHFSHFHYENFLLIMLCKYDLGLIQFGLLKVFFCGLFLWSSVEVTFGYMEVMNILISYTKDFIYGLYSAPSLPDAHALENLGMLIEPTWTAVDVPTADASVQEEIDKLEAIKAAEIAEAKDKLINRGHIYACAALILYVGMQVAKSGGC